MFYLITHSAHMEERKMFYLMIHSTHFIYGYMASEQLYGVGHNIA